MLRPAVHCILIALLLTGAVPAPAADLTVAEQVGKLKIGRKIKVKLNSGEILKGRMGSATADQFSLEPPTAAQGTARGVRFAEAQSVKPDGLATWKKWAIGIAVAWVALGIAGSRV